MKKKLIVLSALCFACVQTWGIPGLQLDTVPGGYNVGTETVVATDNPFTLYALVDTLNSEYAAGATYYLSMAIVPKNDAGGFGSFTVDGVTYDQDTGMQYGIPPVADPVSNPAGNIGPHGIFETYYAEISFTLDPTKKASEYNTQDDPGAFTADATGTLLYEDFTVDVSGLADGFAVHFDLYTVDGDGRIDQFAPFSHDAQSGGGNGVPDASATLALLGLAMVGIEGFRRRFVK